MDDLLTARDIDRLVTLGGKFLRAASTRPAIMQLLLGLGYSDAEHKEGWQLYLQMLGYVGSGTLQAATDTTAQDRVDAMNRIDRFDEPAFRRARAALERLHPDQHQYMFANGLVPKTGLESIASVRTFLDRYAALRDGTDPGRAGKKKADRAAAATLEARNIINPTLEKELRALIDLAQSLAPSPGPAQTVSETALQSSAVQFRSWLRDWRTTASAGIVRRDYRILLGISRRRSATAVADEDGDGTDEVDVADSDSGDSNAKAPIESTRASSA